MQRKNQTQHPHLLLRYEAVLSCEFIFEALFLLIIFRHSSPHHLIKVLVLRRLFQPISPPLPTAVQNQEEDSWITEGHFIHTVLGCCLQVLPADNPILLFWISPHQKKPQAFPGRTGTPCSIFLSSADLKSIKPFLMQWQNGCLCSRFILQPRSLQRGTVLPQHPPGWHHCHTPGSKKN